MSKAGPITLALGLVIGGLVLLLHNLGAIANLEWLWKLWPVLIIGIGLEYFIKRVLVQEEDVHFHIPSLLLILLLILLGGITYAASNIGRNIDSFIGGIPFHQTSLDYSRNWQADPVAVKAGEQLVIDNRVGRVELLPGDGDVVQVSAVIQSPGHGPARELVDKLNPGIRRENGRVLVTVPQVPDTDSGLTGYIVTDFKITVPDGVHVQVQSGTGRVIAQNMDINLAITGTTGSIELNNIGGNVEARNNTGRLEVLDPGGDLIAETNTGSIKVASSKPLNGQYNLKSNTGKISLMMPKNSDLVMEARSATGRVSVLGLPDDRSKSGPSDEYSYTLGAGKGRADLEVGVGTINIEVK